MRGVSILLVDRTIFYEKKRCIHEVLSHQFFGVALFLCSDQFRRCNFKSKYRMEGAPHARPTVIEIDCESRTIQIYRVIIFRSTLSKTANVFIGRIKSSSILARRAIFLFSTFIELSNRHCEIERDFYIAHSAVAFVCSSTTLAVYGGYNYRLVKL